MELKNARLVLIDFLCGQNIDLTLMQEAVKTILEYPSIVPRSEVSAGDVNKAI